MGKANEMYQCQVHYCGFVYDPDEGLPRAGVKPGTKFQDLPEDWKCPFCGAGKHLFKPLCGPGSVMWENVQTNPSMHGKTKKEVEDLIDNCDVQLQSPDAARTKTG